MEIKRGLVVGDLRDRQVAALPVAGAIGRMMVPAAIYTVLNLGGAGSGGWAIPMATGIAFALAVLAVVGTRAPREPQGLPPRPRHCRRHRRDRRHRLVP
jgi:NhaA family Na+:H+ antiporter